MDCKKLLEDLNAVLEAHGARIYIEGYEWEAWINHVDDNWTKQEIDLNAWDGRLHDTWGRY